MTQQSLPAGFLPTAKSETTSPPWARPSVHRTMLDIAQVLSRRATCPKLTVGCVLTDAFGRIVGTGYNGVPRGIPHCIDHACVGHGGAAGSDTCIAVHAEQNALMRCAHVDQVINCYVTHAPCMRCTKMLMNTGCIVPLYYYTDIYMLDDSVQGFFSNPLGYKYFMHCTIAK